MSASHGSGKRLLDALREGWFDGPCREQAPEPPTGRPEDTQEIDIDEIADGLVIDERAGD